ncbi:MAG: TonB-dependent receptor [Sphingomicrobium sp.]
MQRRVWRNIALGSGFLASATPAAAQRANENVVASAEDAFGTSVGNERVGLYNPSSARGFSPIVAGNVRIEGLYFDLQGLLPERLVSGSTMRVGLTAQSYPFPAPTGIADFTLRKPDGLALLSTAVTGNTFGGVRVEIDGQMPISEGLSVAAGASYDLDQLAYGGARTILSAAIIPRWQPSENIDVIGFWSISDNQSFDAQPVLFTGGSFLPPRIERRRRFSASWSNSEIRYTNYGLLSTVRSGAWSFRGGLFRSLTDNPLSFSDISLNTDRQGVGDRFIIAEANREFGSFSGELRASRLIADGERSHIVHLTVRGREQRRRYGGGQTLSFGRIRYDELPDVPRPDFSFGPQTRDRVRQFTAGIGYQGLWRQVGELSLGVQKTVYRKSGERPIGPIPVSKDDPVLMNGTLSIYASEALFLYAGYAKGLEESPIAPTIAVNRDEAPPAIITEQKDAGIRMSLTPDLRLVAGVFDIRKPYFALDGDLLYRNLGELRNRGLEVSLAGKITPRLSAVLGLVLIDSKLSGTAVDEGLVGRRPIDSVPRYASAAVDYATPWVDGLSLDLRYENYGRRPADRLNSFYIPARHVVSVGSRYRFKIGGKPTTLRAQIASLTNHYTPALTGEGFFFNVPRRLIVSLTTDW